MKTFPSSIFSYPKIRLVWEMQENRQNTFSFAKSQNHELVNQQQLYIFFNTAL